MEFIPKRRLLQAANKKMAYVLTIRGIERAEWRDNLFILYKILFVALCIILRWNIANLTSFVALIGRR